MRNSEGIFFGVVISLRVEEYGHPVVYDFHSPVAITIIFFKFKRIIQLIIYLFEICLKQIVIWQKHFL